METRTEPAPFESYPQPKRRIWPYIVIALLLLITFGIYSCAKAVNRGRAYAKKLVSQFHEMLNREDFDAIYNQSDPGYRTAVGG